MNGKKAFYLMLGGSALMVLLIGGTMYFGITLLGKKSWDLVVAKTDNDVTIAQLNAYRKLETELKEYGDLQALIKQVLPADKEQSKVLAEISSLVESVGAGGLSRVQFGESASSIAAGGGGPTQTKADDIKGVFILPASVELKSGATYNQILELIKLIEQNQRKMQITGLTILPDDENRNLLNQAIIKLDIYLKP